MIIGWKIGQVMLVKRVIPGGLKEMIDQHLSASK